MFLSNSLFFFFPLRRAVRDLPHLQPLRMDRRRGSDDASDSSGSSQSRSFEHTRQQERTSHVWSQMNSNRSEPGSYSRAGSGEADEAQELMTLVRAEDSFPLLHDSVYSDTSFDGFGRAKRKDLYHDPHVYESVSVTRDFPSETSSPPSVSLKGWYAHGEQGRLSRMQYRDEYTQLLNPQQQTQRHSGTDADADEDRASSSFKTPETSTPSANEKSCATPKAEAVEVEMHDQSDVNSDKKQARFVDNNLEPVSTNTERMKYEVPEDPRNLIINVIVNSASASVTLQEIHNALQWEEQFEATNGSVLEYLQGYQSIFAVSPIDDRVTLRRPLKTAKGRRKVRGQRGHCSIPNKIGSISYSYVASAFDLDALSAIYKRRGYDTALIYEVLHVSSHRIFDMFLFPNGVVVWWGLNRRDHWLVEDDFLSSVNSFVREGVKERHAQKAIDDLFPFWCSYELDEHYDSSTPSRREEALERFGTHLCFDHYLIPVVKPLRTQIMLTVSYSLGRTAVVDFFDNMTHHLQKQVLAIPSDIKSLFDYFSMRHHIAHREGEIQLARSAIMALRDSPEFLWEMPWLDDYYQLAERQNASGQLLMCFIAKSDALLQQLAYIKTRRFCLFILGSDVFLILILVADVFFIMAGFILKLYFNLGKEETAAS
ncbi:putative ACR, YagE family COG1723 [Trypanosoma cruzi]|nr:putative ACR, YagE family COG1723 [Trypanosoma cruzi]